MVNEDKPGDGALELFLSIGLDERTAQNTIANNKANFLDGCKRTVGNLLYTVATKLPANALARQPSLLKHIISFKVKTPDQLDAEFAFFSKIGSDNFKLDEFEEVCGVGVEVSTEEIELVVSDVFPRRRVQSWSTGFEIHTLWIRKCWRS